MTIILIATIGPLRISSTVSVLPAVENGKSLHAEAIVIIFVALDLSLQPMQTIMK